MRIVSEKMGIKENTRGIFINVPESAINAIDPPELELASRLSGEFDYIHFFAKSLAELRKKISTLKCHLKATGMLWVSWPKGGQMGTDLNLRSVIKTGYDSGLVESKTLSIDDTRAALKFTHPRKGKVYNNSYGKLKNR